MAAVVYKKPPRDGSVGNLFAGYSFWVSANVPQRNRFKELIQINGGTLLLLEKDADFKLVDHTKRDHPLNSYSFTFVEKSIRTGQLQDPEEHRVGGSVRPVGAPRIPSRTSRIPFSLQDDQFVWDWMQPYERRGGQVSGNVMYQQLAEQNPRHTFQSWRDRYLRYLKGRPRPGGPARDDQSVTASNVSRSRVTNQVTPSSSVSNFKKSNIVDISAPETATNRKRKIRSYEDDPGHDPNRSAGARRRVTSPVSSTGLSPFDQTRDTSTDTTDESQSTKYETAPQYPQSKESQEPNLHPLGKDRVEAPLEKEMGKEDHPAGDLETWVQKRIDRGRNSDHILLALTCTCLNVKLADQVLNILSAGNPIPDDIPGVWTEDDDNAIMGSDGRAMERILKKHGDTKFNERFLFLEQSRMAAEEDT